MPVLAPQATSAAHAPYATPAPVAVAPSTHPEAMPVANVAPAANASQSAYARWRKKKREEKKAAEAAAAQAQGAGASSPDSGASQAAAAPAQENEYDQEGDQEQEQRNEEWQAEEAVPDQVQQEEQLQEGEADMSGEPVLGPSTLAGMPVSITLHEGALCVLGACETQWGTIPLACRFGVDASEANRAIDLNAPQTPAVLAALGNAERTLGAMATREAADLAVEDLITRARVGDQNAMAMIAEVRRVAMGGGAKASEAMAKIKAYLKAHPFHAESAMGLDTEPTLPKSAVRAATALANGPLLSRDRLLEIAKSLGSNAKAFLYACANYHAPAKINALAEHYPDAESALRTGATAGRARAIQLVRMPDSRIAAFSPHAAWELGE